LSLGIAYFRKGDSKQAEDIFRKILQLNPSNNFARNSLAALYIESKRFVEAEKALEVALKDLSFPDQHKALFNLAIIQEKRGQILRAEKTLQKSLKENPNFCPGWMKLSEIQLRQSKRAEAIDSLQSGSVGLCYSFTQNHYQLGLLHMQMNDNQSAREKFDEIARRFPKTHWAKLANEKLNIIQGRN
jgi:Tfp pilus assembly protein PilF